MSCEEKMAKLLDLLDAKEETRVSFFASLKGLTEKEKEKILGVLVIFAERMQKKRAEGLKEIQKINRKISEIKNEAEEEKEMAALEDEMKIF